MRRITLWSLSTLTTLVLLFSYHTSTSSKGSTVAAPVIAQAANGAAVPTPSATTPSATTPSETSTTDSSASGSSGAAAAPTPSASASSSSSSSASSSAAAKTYAGDAIGTRYGDVQVQITVKSGKITASAVLQVPWNDNRDQEINSYAVPILNQEAVASQSSTIDMVSGATYTSDGYIQSLQSAIDQAHL